jgi:ADP-ribose pyrophosphatase
MRRLSEEKYGYKTISSVLDHKNPYYAIYKDEIRYPDGKVKPYWVQNKDDFSIIVPLFPDKSTLLIGQYRLPADFYSWEFPMGSTNGRDPLENAKKELEEEAGYSASTWKHLGSYLHAPGRAPTTTSIFLAEDLTKGEAHPEESEFLETQQVSLQKVENMIENGIIQDGPTIVAYHFLENYLKNQ